MHSLDGGGGHSFEAQVTSPSKHWHLWHWLSITNSSLCKYSTLFTKQPLGDIRLFSSVVVWLSIASNPEVTFTELVADETVVTFIVDVVLVVVVAVEVAVVGVYEVCAVTVLAVESVVLRTGDGGVSNFSHS